MENNIYNVDLGTSINSLNEKKEFWTNDGRPRVSHKQSKQKEKKLDK